MDRTRMALLVLSTGLVLWSCAGIGEGFDEDLGAASDAVPGVADTPGLDAGADSTGPWLDPGPEPTDPGEAPTDPGPAADQGETTPDPGLDEDSTLDAASPGGPCTPCKGDSDCPDGYECTEYGDEDGSFCGAGCVLFECTAQAHGKTTTCKRVNEHGSCEGERECADLELSTCSADEPEADLCDGLDNDCDGETDLGFPDSDGDDEANCIDDDDDDDGLVDESDNCPLVPNADQDDLDGDGLGDACDPDIDGDGTFNTLDCAPDDPNVASASPEKCDEIDNDCDGETDEQDAMGCSLYYPDLDDDGFGANQQGKCLCGPGESFKAPAAGDCDDTTEKAAPDVPEECDLIDNDCNGKTDEPGATGCEPFHYDADGDGWYTEGAGMACLCGPDPATLYTGSSPGDCNDTSQIVHPDAAEQCNGLDDNCNFSVDEGCDDDVDGFCDDSLVFVAAGTATCPFGAGDCDDEDGNVHPGAEEICDGKDTDCDPVGDVAEGTSLACGPECKPCPIAPGGSPYKCSGLGPDAQCVIDCPEGTFCEDCSCTGTEILSLGPEVKDARAIYDAYIDAFRVAYFQSGVFKLRAISPTGGLGSDLLAVAIVTKWTDWGLAQSSVDGSFMFGWTGYPDSAVHIGVADSTGAYDTQYTVMEDLPGVLARQNVQVGWHDGTKTHLVVWDETASGGSDLRGIVLNAGGTPMGDAFTIAGGNGSQFGASLAPRGEGKGYFLAHGTELSDSSPPALRALSAQGSTEATFDLTPDGKPGASPDIWYDHGMGRGVVQWLGTDNQYHAFLFGETGLIGEEIDTGAPLGAVIGAPQKGNVRVFFNAGGEVWMRTVDMTTGVLSISGLPVSSGGPIKKIVGAVRHPTGYALVLWTTGSQLYGKLVAP